MSTRELVLEKGSKGENPTFSKSRAEKVGHPLAYPNDLVYVNGAKFNGSFPDNADVPD
jgi:hypothetical protein